MGWFDRFVTFDTETTGFNGDARIIEISCVVFEGGEVKKDWSTLLLPQGVDWENENVKKALEVNKITREQLEGQPSFPEVFHRMYMQFGSASVWSAHNAEFDMRMLNQEFRRYKGIDFPLQPRFCFDTMHLSRAIHPNERFHKLGDVAVRWGVEQGDAHRASSDAVTCGRILLSMAKGHLPDDIVQINELQKATSTRWATKRRA
jgi:DNA polymerase-3 subunit epsilon